MVVQALTASQRDVLSELPTLTIGKNGEVIDLNIDIQKMHRRLDELEVDDRQGLFTPIAVRNDETIRLRLDEIDRFNALVAEREAALTANRHAEDVAAAHAWIAAPVEERIQKLDWGTCDYLADPPRVDLSGCDVELQKAFTSAADEAYAVADSLNTAEAEARKAAGLAAEARAEAEGQSCAKEIDQMLGSYGNLVEVERRAAGLMSDDEALKIVADMLFSPLDEFQPRAALVPKDCPSSAAESATDGQFAVLRSIAKAAAQIDGAETVILDIRLPGHPDGRNSHSQWSRPGSGRGFFDATSRSIELRERS
jgi:hypothetical protein